MQVKHMAWHYNTGRSAKVELVQDREAFYRVHFYRPFLSQRVRLYSPGEISKMDRDIDAFISDPPRPPFEVAGGTWKV